MNKKLIPAKGLALLLFSALLISCSAPTDKKTGNPVDAIVQTLQVFESRTPYPTATEYPTQAQYPTPTINLLPSQTPPPTATPWQIPTLVQHDEQVILMLPGVWSRDTNLYVQCGDQFEVRYGYRQPYFSYAVGNEVSKSQFLTIDLFVRNLSDHTLPLLFHKQFKLIGNVNSKLEEFVSYGPAGIAASDRWGVPFLSSQGIPPGVEIETYLSFDVNHHGTDWKLVFESDDSANFDCQFSLDIPQPDFPIRYYETQESANRL